MLNAADCISTNLFLQLPIRIYLRKVFHLEISQIIFCLKNEHQMPFGGFHFHSSLKVQKNICVSMANIKAFNWYSYLFSVKQTLLDSVQIPVSSQAWIIINKLTWLSMVWVLLCLVGALSSSFYSFYRSLPFLFFNSPYSTSLVSNFSLFSIRDSSYPVVGGHTQNCYSSSSSESVSQLGSSLCSTGHLWRSESLNLDGCCKILHGKSYKYSS